MKTCLHDSYPIYKGLICPLRERAKELGYALAVHGTLRRDIDLVAIPWEHDAASASELAEELRKVAEKINGHAQNHDAIRAANPRYRNDGRPGYKPHGRLSFVFHLFPEKFGESAPYIDLAVMPRVQDVDARPSMRFRDFASYQEAEAHHQSVTPAAGATAAESAKAVG